MIRILSKLVLCLLFVTGPISCAQVSSLRSFEIPSGGAVKNQSLFELGRPLGLSQSEDGNWSCSVEPTRGLELILLGQFTDLLKLAVEKHDTRGSKAAVACFLETESFLDRIFHIAAERCVLNVLMAARAWYRNGTANLESSTVQLHECLEWMENYNEEVGQAQGEPMARKLMDSPHGCGQKSANALGASLPKLVTDAGSTESFGNDVSHHESVPHLEAVVNERKEVVLAYTEAFNRGDLDALCALFSADAQIWGVLGWGTIEQARPVWKDLIECLQIQLHVDSIIAEGNTVVVRYTERGKSVRTFRGAGPTQRGYELLAMEWFEIRDNLIHRRWATRDSVAQNRQLGFA